MNKIIITTALALTITACGVSDPKAPTIEVNPKTAIKIMSVIPYAKGSKVSTSIKNECKIQSQLSEFIQSYAAGEGVGVLRKNKVSKKAKGKVLVVKITEAVSSGNAFIGHRKFSSIAGTLYKNGKKGDSFTATRISGGGAWAGFKGSCSVLGRTVKALGSDVTRWLKNPVDGAHLGDGV